MGLAAAEVKGGGTAKVPPRCRHQRGEPGEHRPAALQRAAVVGHGLLEQALRRNAESRMQFLDHRQRQPAPAVEHLVGAGSDRLRVDRIVLPIDLVEALQ